MFCIQCGKKIEEGIKFCTSCGESQNKEPAAVHTTKTAPEAKADSTSASAQVKPHVNDERWWHRLAKVFYFGMYLNLLWIIPLVWTENDEYCVGWGVSKSCVDTSDEAFWAVILTIVIFVTIWRGIKLIFLYVVKGQTVNWKREFKSFF